MLIPKLSHKLKCLSYPGTGHKTEVLSLPFQGPDPFPSTKRKVKYCAIKAKLLLPPAHTKSGEHPKILAPSFLQDSRPFISP